MSRKPRYVAHGTYGCVFKPAVACAGQPNIPSKNAVVAKLFRDPYKADEEAHIHETVVNSIDPQHAFTVQLFQYCPISRDSYKQLYKCKNWTEAEKSMPHIEQLVYENGGIELSKVAKTMRFEELFVKFRKIVKGLHMIERAGYVHLDIKPMNIVYNPSTGKMSLIDFGIASYKQDIYNDRKIIEFEYPYFPPEFQIVGCNNMGATIPHPKKHYSNYYKNIRYALRLNKLGMAPDGASHTLLRLWNALTNKNRDLNILHAYVKAQSADPERTLASKAGEYTDRVDVYMLGATLLEVFSIAYRSGQASINAVNMSFYEAFLQLVYDMTYVDPRQRLTPANAYTRFLKVRAHVKDIPNAPPMSIESVVKSKRIDRRHLNFSSYTLCKKFKENPTVNPLTNRKIKQGGPTHTKLIKRCTSSSNT